MNYEVNRHSRFYLRFHLVLVTKYRHPVIDTNIEKQLIDIAYNIFENHWGVKIEQINTNKNHIHILFSSKPQVKLSDLINDYR